MAIIKRKQGSHRFQVKVRGSDGRWISRCFKTHSEAESLETEVRHRMHVNVVVTNQSRHILLRDYFGQWFDSRDNQTSAGWRRHQLHLYRAYVDPLIGDLKLGSITPQLISQILVEMARLGRSAQTRLHVFNLLRKMFGDAIEMFQILIFNPVLRKLRPRVPIMEAWHLNLIQIKQLLLHVRGRACGLGIWVQLFLGLRMGELQALTWDDLDFETGTIHIRRCFVRLDGCFKEYPKGGKQHSKRIPVELLDYLQKNVPRVPRKKMRAKANVPQMFHARPILVWKPN